MKFKYLFYTYIFVLYSIYLYQNIQYFSKSYKKFGEQDHN